MKALEHKILDHDYNDNSTENIKQVFNKMYKENSVVAA